MYQHPPRGVKLGVFFVYGLKTLPKAPLGGCQEGVLFSVFASWLSSKGAKNPIGKRKNKPVVPKPLNFFKEK